MPSRMEASAELIPAMPWERRGRVALTGAWWARALRLDERRAAEWGGIGLGGDGDDGRAIDEAAAEADGGDGDAETEVEAAAAEAAPATTIAEIRWERWQRAYSPAPHDALARQAAAYGCTPEGLRGLLAEPPEVLGRRVGKPGWAGEVERLVAALPAQAAALPEVVRGGGWSRGFSLIIEPFVEETLRRFDALSGGIDTSGIVSLDTFRAEVRQEAARRLVALAGRVLVLELNVLRVTERLDGASPEDRFWSFVRHYRDRAAFAGLLDEYAVLARLLLATAVQTAEAYAEFLRRFARDREDLVRLLLDGADPGPLTMVALSRGDTHDRGRSVGIARFASGRRVVYKPRPLGVHRCFNAVLDWYNQRVPAALSLRTLGLVERSEYGWAEFVQPAPCPDASAAARYFRRQGALLAILHCLGGTDFHFENLMAVGEQPVPVDLETLLCPDLPRSSGSAVVDGDPALTAYLESVGRVGLLPAVMTGHDGRPFDIGGMGGDRDAVIPFRAVNWADAGTDAMSLTRVLPRLGSTHNRPSLDGADLDVVRYAEPLAEGFRDGYRVIAAGRADWTGPHGLLSGFRGERVRVIARATREYVVLLKESTHPDALRDALDREQIFGVLWARSAADPGRTRLVRHEVEDLWAGDVPLFTAAVGSRDLRAVGGAKIEGLSGDAQATGGATIEDLLPETGLERVERLLAGLGEQHLARQQWIVSAHLVTRTTGVELSTADAVRETAAAGSTLTERALAAARMVAGRLEASAYRDGRRLGWLGLDLVHGSRWQVAPLSMDLYNGYPGVALFLAQLADVTGEQRYADLARDVLGPIRDFAREHLNRDSSTGPAAPAVGAFSGLAGTALTLALAATLLDDADLDEPVVPLLEQVTDLISADDGYDVIGGAAGCLAVAESLGADYGAAAYRLAERCVELLQAGAVPVGPGVGWPAIEDRPLLGFSHGASGIAWALWPYAARTGDAQARATAIGALAYEDAEYDERTGNWPDQREDEPADQYTWCHGAPGVGLARAAMLASDAGFEAAARDLRRALAATERFGRYRSHCICHGELGNLELFALAAESLPGQNARRAWRERATAVVADIEQGRLMCGTPAGIETPGLMTGLAGIGHGLLRIAAPERVAPILLLAPPRRTRSPRHPTGTGRRR